MTKKSAIIATTAAVLVLAGGATFAEDTPDLSATQQGVATPQGPGENNCPYPHPNCTRINSVGGFLQSIRQAISGLGEN